MNKTIDTATPKEIAEYLNYLYDTAWEKSNHKTDSDSDCEDSCKIWRDLYYFVFSDEISHKLTKRFGRLDYYDPDTSYYEDVTAYIDAFKEFADCYDKLVSFEDYQKNK